MLILKIRETLAKSVQRTESIDKIVSDNCIKSKCEYMKALGSQEKNHQLILNVIDILIDNEHNHY